MKKYTKKSVSSVGSINNKHKENKEMNIKEFPNVQEQSLTEAQVAAITKDTVSILNGLENRNITGWIDMGKTIHEYVFKIHPEGKYREDPYKLLSACPDSFHKSSQLRNYEACYLLFKEFGGKDGSPKVSMTHFIQVLHLGVNYEAKRQLLLMAEQEKWSVSELKAYISKGKAGSGQDSAATPNYGKELQNCLSTIADLVSHITIKDKQSISKETRMQIVSSVQHLIELNVITFEEINAPAAMKKAA